MVRFEDSLDSLEKVRSPLATDTGYVRIILWDIDALETEQLGLKKDIAPCDYTHRKRIHCKSMIAMKTYIDFNNLHGDHRFLHSERDRVILIESLKRRDHRYHVKFDMVNIDLPCSIFL